VIVFLKLLIIVAMWMSTASLLEALRVTSKGAEGKALRVKR
jgi:hypothetical protein